MMPIASAAKSAAKDSAPATWAVMSAAVLGTALAYMSDDMLNLAVPSVARDLGADMTGVQWILNAYYVPLVAGTLVAGSVGDRIGHRRVFTAGTAVFVAGALGSALAQTVSWLVGARALQGIGAAMLLAAGLALVTRLSAPERRTRAIAQFLGLVAAVPALGPFVSGTLVELLSWRWLFVIPLVLPAIALLLLRIGVPETHRIPDRSLDAVGAMLLTGTIGTLAFALIVGSQQRGGLSIAALGLGAVGAAMFALVERRSPDPLLPLRLLRRRRFIGGNIVWLIAAMTSWGAVFFLAVMLQTSLRQSPFIAGLALTPIYLTMMIGSPLAGRLAERFGSGPPILIGLTVYVAGLLLLSRLTASSTVFPETLLAVEVFAVGMAIFTAPLAALTMLSLDQSDQGIASGMNNAVGQLAGLLAIIVLPAAAGLSGTGLGDPAFAAGFSRAMVVMAVLAGAGAVIAGIVLARRPGVVAHAPA
jgi:EmrB/QacA subfamily drug resistance transporter